MTRWRWRWGRCRCRWPELGCY